MIRTTKATLSLLAVLALPFSGMVHGSPIDLGNVSIDWGPGGTALPWAGTTDGFFLYRQQYTTTGYYADYPSDPDAYLHLEVAGTATIAADPGRYITTATIGFSYGGFNNFHGGYSTSSIDWTVNGGVFSDPIGTTGGPRSTDIYRYQGWEITSASGGHAGANMWLGFSNYFPAAGNDPTGFYTINATSFSVDVKSILEIVGGGPFNRAETMSFALFVQTAEGAPPVPTPVPEQGGLMLYVLGFGALAGALRLRQAHATLIRFAHCPWQTRGCVGNRKR